MSSRGILLLVALVVVVVGCDKQNGERQSRKVDIGQVFPTVSVRDRDDKTVQLSLKSNTISVVNIWATWCGPCRHEMPSLQHLSEILLNKDASSFQVIGISADDDPILMHEYLIDKKITFPNYRDDGMQVINNVLGVRAFPSTYIVGRDGRVVKIIEAWRYWDETDIVNELLALAGKER